MKPGVRAVETDNAADGETPEEAGAPAPPPTAFHAFAERIGSRNLMLAIVTMPLFFLGALVVIIALVGLPEDDPAAPSDTDAVLEALSAPPVAAAPIAEASPAESAAEVAAPPPTASALGAVALIPAGGIALDGDRLAVRIDTAEGQVIVIYDLARGEVIQQVPLSSLGAE